MTESIEGIDFRPERAMQLYREGDHDELCDYLLSTLGVISSRVWTRMTPERTAFVNSFLNHFGYLFTQPDFTLSTKQSIAFVRRNLIIANLAAVSAFETTDIWLKLVLGQRKNIGKILTLYNARCHTRFKAEALFNAAGGLASLWYSIYFDVFRAGTLTERLWNNARNHVASMDRRWRYIGPITGHFYFFTSYFALESEYRLKRFFHQNMGDAIKAPEIRSRPNPKRIAIVSARWQRTSAVYKSLAPYVHALLPDYELTLVRLGRRKNDNFELDWFKDIRHIDLVDGAFDLEEIRDNDFALAYFPDIGMEPEDKFLCNLRLAPIQAMGYGHPVSTHGGAIDYFIGGQEVERLEDAEVNYSERLVAIPGLGAYPVLPESQPPAAIAPSQSEPLYINCVWTAHKCAHPHLQTLAGIARKSPRALCFRFFVGKNMLDQGLAPVFERELAEALAPGSVEIIYSLRYSAFQAKLAEGALSLDSYPFGGYNSVVDALVLGKPVVALEGHHAVNRLASALLRRVGLDELIARTPDEYSEKALRLIGDEPYRRRLAEHLKGLDLEATLCRESELGAFKRAIDHLIANHQNLVAEGSRDPILID